MAGIFIQLTKPSLPKIGERSGARLFRGVPRRSASYRRGTRASRLSAHLRSLRKASEMSPRLLASLAALASPSPGHQTEVTVLER